MRRFRHAAFRLSDSVLGLRQAHGKKSFFHGNLNGLRESCFLGLHLVAEQTDAFVKRPELRLDARQLQGGHILQQLANAAERFA